MSENVPSKSNMQKIGEKKIGFCWRFEGQGRKLPDQEPDPLVRGMDPRILIRTKMSRINNTGQDRMLPLSISIWYGRHQGIPVAADLCYKLRSQ
jgi:hypothetical protein